MTGGYDGPALERLVPEPEKEGSLGRSPFERDRARVLHSAALRRLAGKTQVVGVGEDDFPRTRLTHSLECAQIGRELAGELGADPDVVDAGCLAHDLGHPPYGHNGETALDAAAAACGGFEGNAQSLRILTRLEAKVEGAGLNLTRAVLDAATKYPWPRVAGSAKYGVYADDLPTFEWMRQGAPTGGPCVEAQIMDWSDDVAYSVHDLEDGVHAGSIPLDRLDPAAVVALAGCSAELLAELRRQPWWLGSYDGSHRAQVGLKRMSSALIGRFTAAAVRATRAAHGPGPIRRYDGGVVVPDWARAECELLKAITAHYVMTRRVAVQERQRELLTSLVAALAERAPDALDPALRPAWEQAADDAARLRVVIDSVASLTDASAQARHDRLLPHRAAGPEGIMAAVTAGGPEAPPRIEQAAAATIRPLRHAVLRPGQPFEVSVHPTDDEATHFAAYDPEGRLAGVATVFEEPYPGSGEPAWRLRGMAVAPEARGGGYGGALLRAAMDHASRWGGSLLWCNARVSALGFYLRYGFVVASDVFDVPGGGPHHRLRRPLP